MIMARLDKLVASARLADDRLVFYFTYGRRHSKCKRSMRRRPRKGASMRIETTGIVGEPLLLTSATGSSLIPGFL